MIAVKDYQNDSFRTDTPPVKEPPPLLPFKERLYAKVKIKVKTLDMIIGVLVVAIIVCIVVGALKGNGII